LDKTCIAHWGDKRNLKRKENLEEISVDKDNNEVDLGEI
jgi:hypothetical protein